MAWSRFIMPERNVSLMGIEAIILPFQFHTFKRTVTVSSALQMHIKDTSLESNTHLDNTLSVVEYSSCVGRLDHYDPGHILLLQCLLYTSRAASLLDRSSTKR